MKHKLLLLTLLINGLCYAQIGFEKGYFINNANQRTECLIKNMDSRSNPTEFEYKLSENDSPLNANLKTATEFGVYSESKYIKAKVYLDRSSENIAILSEDINPVLKEEDLFLKVLIEGKASLYEYIDDNLIRFFYKTEDKNIEQLIYKSYLTNNQTIGKNNKFKQQLWNDLKCPSFKMNRFENQNYDRKSLIKLFVEYSECNNLETQNFELKKKRDLFNLTLRPRLNNSVLTIQNSGSNTFNTVFENKSNIGFGIEFEFILPFNKNKWSLLVEPTYQSYKSEKTTDNVSVSGGKVIAKIDYKSVEIPIGIRHYFFINDQSKLFVNGSLLVDLNLNSTLEFERNDGSKLNSLELETRLNYGFGLGYKQNDKYSIEFRYLTNRELLGKYIAWNSDYKTISIILGYSFF